jgi:hypothetical protein
MITPEHLQAAVLQVDALNHLLEKLWAQRVDARLRTYDAMRALRQVRLTLAEEACAAESGER